MKTPDGAVAWQWRINLPGVGWTQWDNGGTGPAPLAHSTEYAEREHRALIPAASLDALRAELTHAQTISSNRFLLISILQKKLDEAESALAAVGALVVEMRDNAEYVAVDPHDHFLQGSAAASEEYANKLAAIIADAGDGDNENTEVTK